MSDNQATKHMKPYPRYSQLIFHDRLAGCHPLGRIIILLIILCCSISQVAVSQEAISIGRNYRALAMGNTGVASSIDSAALYYNPAMLANVKGMFIDYAAFTLEASQGFTIADGLPLIISPTFPFVNRDGIADSLKLAFVSKTNPYVRSIAGVNIAVNLAQQGFTVAGSYFTENIATIPDGSTNIYQRGDTIMKAGVSYPIGLGQIVLGAAVSQITRKISNQSPIETLTTFSAEATATAYDIGLLYRMANQARVTWGISAMNFGGVSFSDATYNEPQQLAIGVSMNQEFGSLKFTPALDMRQISATTGKTNTIHMGLEVGLLPNSTGGSALTYRMGYNQGYVSYGLEMNMLNHSLIVGYTQYGEEIGSGSTKLENRRTIVYLSMGF